MLISLLHGRFTNLYIALSTDVTMFKSWQLHIYFFKRYVLFKNKNNIFDFYLKHIYFKTSNLFIK